ncbi:ACB domain-containing protein [Fusarium keratoplasticum]|nr:ACB domain-containing protein [Fusarium keratoplasticum]
MAAPQSDAFKKAIEDSKKLTSKPGPDELLQLYALYKVGTGEDFSKTTAPGTFDFKASSPYAPPNADEKLTHPQGKAKYNAWKKVAEEGVTPDAAQEQYVKLVEELKEKYGYDENKVPEAVGAN